mmetsp:Transcript_4104/g.6942  ORF Transcript_4104/g.6942 Transcript_4104/m.6942 type:complete len:192 (+) Transcript_4104:695-1270(+)
MIKPQQYRMVTIGPEDLLQNGQMVQVSICDAFDPLVFHPTDKVLLAKHNDKYYAIGTFCGYDFHDLSKGAMLGPKVGCPGCGSFYDIESGAPEEGPNLRNLSSFQTRVRDGKLEMVVPEHIPAFQKSKYLKRSSADPRVMVIVGDTDTSLSAIQALRQAFTGKIVLVPIRQFGRFENNEIMRKSFFPLSKN